MQIPHSFRLIFQQKQNEKLLLLLLLVHGFKCVSNEENHNPGPRLSTTQPRENIASDGGFPLLGFALVYDAVGFNHFKDHRWKNKCLWGSCPELAANFQ